MTSGVNALNRWYIDKVETLGQMDKRLLTPVEMHLLTQDMAHPTRSGIETVCMEPHSIRSPILVYFLDEVRQGTKAKLGLMYKPQFLEGYLAQIQKYVKKYEALDDSVARAYGDWSIAKTMAYRPVSDKIKKLAKAYASVDLTDDNATKDHDPEGGNGSPLSPEGVRLVIGYYRGVIKKLKENNFKKLPNYGQEGRETTGLTDYLDASQALYCVIMGYNAGHRAQQDFELQTVHDGKIVVHNGKNIGVWFVQNGARKDTRMVRGKIYRRSPFLIL